MRAEEGGEGEGSEDEEERRGVTGGRDRLAERLQQDAAEVRVGFAGWFDSLVRARGEAVRDGGWALSGGVRGTAAGVNQ